MILPAYDRANDNPLYLLFSSSLASHSILWVAACKRTRVATSPSKSTGHVILPVVCYTQCFPRKGYGPAQKALEVSQENPNLLSSKNSLAASLSGRLV